MNPQDLGSAIGLAAVIGGCFALAFVDPWLARRRWRKGFRSVTAERRARRNSTRAA
jgi:hypothetical protein